VASYGCPAGVGRRTHQDNTAEDEEERYNTRSAFETFRTTVATYI
jgi:hypothetical protein